MEITSKPTALDEINRAVLKLEMERLSLTNDTDRASRDRLSRLEAELSLLKEKQAQLTEQWEHEKSVMTRLQSIKEEVCWCWSSLSVIEIFYTFIHLVCCDGCWKNITFDVSRGDIIWPKLATVVTSCRSRVEFFGSDYYLLGNFTFILADRPGKCGDPAS